MVRKTIIVRRCSQCGLSGHNFKTCSKKNNSDNATIALPIVTITIYEKAMNNLCSEQRIIYADKRVNNFLNNAEHKIILCRMLEIVYAENSEQFS